MIQPEGSRFLLDKKQKFVSWMGFEFFVSTSSDTGVALHDIRFGGDSIIYELGLQEALAHYAGDDPQQGILEYLDTTFLMGLRSFELVPGYDCPAYAIYLSTTYHMEGTSVTNKNSICIFEYTADHVLSRHTSDFQVSVSRNTYLVVRSVATLGNYDYTIDYMFYLDGTIEVKVRASGYIFGAFWAPTGEKKMSEHGYRVHDAMATSMHDHVINFKADLDIAGTANTLNRVSIEPVTLEFPWDDEITTPRNTMQLVNRTVKRETGLDWPRNAGEMYIVTNEDSENAWGEKRGYRIAAGTGMGNPSHLSILNSTTLGDSANWAARDLWFVKQRDTEPKSASSLNYYQPLDPLVDFSKFIKDENIEQEDL
jgi:primary-amine oxidase